MTRGFEQALYILGTRRPRVRRQSPLLRDGTGSALRYSGKSHREEGSVPRGSS